MRSTVVASDKCSSYVRCMLSAQAGHVVVQAMNDLLAEEVLHRVTHKSIAGRQARLLETMT